MAKRADDAVIMRAYILRRLGLTLREIMEHLSEEFDEESIIPDQSTIHRRLKKIEESPPETLAEDVPFHWATMTTVPWEYSRLILDIQAQYETTAEGIFGPFTVRLAKWCYRVTLAMDNEYRLKQTYIEDDIELPTYSDAMMVAMEYSWREMASVILNDYFKTEDLDLWMIHTPWRSREFFERYHKVKYPDGWLGPNESPPVVWHVGDTLWLKDVDPEAARTMIASGLAAESSRSLRENSDIDSLLVNAWKRSTDGLLNSQLDMYRRKRLKKTPKAGDSEEKLSEPWYFEWLDDVRRNTDHDRLMKLAQGR